MSTLIASPQFKLYAICAVILSFLMFVLGFITAARRAKYKNYMNPEDKVVAAKDATLLDGGEHPEVARVIRAHRNLLESLPSFIVLGLLCAIAGASPLGAQICIGVFTGARVLHARSDSHRR